SYNGQSTRGGGTLLRPDLATRLPDVSADGLTWTFHLGPGLHYAPPLQTTEITSADFVRSVERLLGPPPPDLPRPMDRSSTTTSGSSWPCKTSSPERATTSTARQSTSRDSRPPIRTRSRSI